MTLFLVASRRAVACGLLFALVLLAVGGSLARGAGADVSTAFWSPSHTIRCVVERSPQPPSNWQLGCTVMSARRSFLLSARGKPRRTVFDLTKERSVEQFVGYTTLPYRTQKVAGPFACTSRIDGVTCRNAAGHGWSLSRESQKLR